MSNWALALFKIKKKFRPFIPQILFDYILYRPYFRGFYVCDDI